MKSRGFVLSFFVLGAAAVAATDDDPQIVFRSDVSLVRVDVRVVDGGSRTVANLKREDFVLRDSGRQQQIRNFAAEEMPLDVLLLLDVSGSMQSHVQRIAEASRQALEALGQDDRVAIMVFDRATRVRMPFRSSREDIVRELNAVVRHEGFNGGTDITRALLDATNYVVRSARKEARRAIVILTDDQTERERDEARVSRALMNGDTVLSALIAPDALRRMRYPPGVSGGGSWPGGGWPGDIIFGRRMPPGGRGGNYPPGGPASRTHSAGTTEIANESGGDSMPVDDAMALETTLARIRQRYSLYFSVPAAAQAGEDRTISVDLASAARRRYPNAEVQYRRAYRTPADLPSSPASTDTTEVIAVTPAPEPREEPTSNKPPVLRRRTVTGESYKSSGPNPAVGAPAASSEPKPAAEEKPTAATQSAWRKATPEDTAPPEQASTKDPKKK